MVWAAAFVRALHADDGGMGPSPGPEDAALLAWRAVEDLRTAARRIDARTTLFDATEACKEMVSCRKTGEEGGQS